MPNMSQVSRSSQSAPRHTLCTVGSRAAPPVERHLQTQASGHGRQVIHHLEPGLAGPPVDRGNVGQQHEPELGMIVKGTTDLHEVRRRHTDGRLVGRVTRFQRDGRKQRAQQIDHARWLSIFFCS
jgi:hypothetical protein